MMIIMFVHFALFDKHQGRQGYDTLLSSIVFQVYIVILSLKLQSCLAYRMDINFNLEQCGLITFTLNEISVRFNMKTLTATSPLINGCIILQNINDLLTYNFPSSSMNQQRLLIMRERVVFGNIWLLQHCLTAFKTQTHEGADIL